MGARDRESSAFLPFSGPLLSPESTKKAEIAGDAERLVRVCAIAGVA